MFAFHSPLQTCLFSGGKFSFPTRSIPCFHALPLQARQGLLFPFCLFRCPSVPSLPPAWMGWLFLIPVCRCPRIRSQLAHTGPTGTVTRFAGVRFPLLGPQNRTQGHRGSSFSLHSEFPPPPFGGRGWVSPVLGLLVFSRREARCFSAGKDGYFVSEGFSRQLPLATAAHNCPTRLQRGGEPASLVSFPTPPSKPHTGPHRAEFGFHRLFLPPFLIGSPASWRSKWQLTAS